MSLSVSDLISALISLFALYRLTWGYDVWHWTDFLCKVRQIFLCFILIQVFTCKHAYCIMPLDADEYAGFLFCAPSQKIINK